MTDEETWELEALIRAEGERGRLPAIVGNVADDPRLVKAFRVLQSKGWLNLQINPQPHNQWTVILFKIEDEATEGLKALRKKLAAELR